MLIRTNMVEDSNVCTCLLMLTVSNIVKKEVG